MSTPSSLYIRVRGRVLGPFDQEKLRALAARGQFGRMHEVSEDGVSWVRASQYPELFRVDERATFQVERTTLHVERTAAERAAPEPATAADAENMIPIAAAAPAAAQAIAIDGAAQAGWHYARNGAQLGPVSFSQLKAMLADGRLSPSESVWTSGMPDWQPADTIQGLSGGGDAQFMQGRKAEKTLSDGVVHSLRDSRPWIIFFAVLGTISTALSLAAGVFLLIMAAKTSRSVGPVLAGQSIGSLVSAVLTGISSWMLFNFAARCRDFTYHRSEHSLQAALESLKSFVVYSGILTIISIVIALILVTYVLVLL